MAQDLSQDGSLARLLQLVKGIVKRDETALAEFYDITSAKAYALALRITRNDANAEEVLSDLYLQVWQQAERFNTSRGNPLSWLLMMCRSRALDHLRRQDRTSYMAERNNNLIALEDPDDSPLDCLLAFQRNSQVHALLATLEESERTLVSLAFFRGLSHQEIAQFTGMPLGSVKSKLRTSLARLRNGLTASVATPGDCS